jgi:putative transposase
MIIAFIDDQREQGVAVESILAVLAEEGLLIAARTYRAWRQGVVADRTHTDAVLVNTIRDLAWRPVVLPDGRRRRQLAAEGLYGRRKMLALVRRQGHPDASRGAVDRAMRLLGLKGVTRSKRVRTTIPAADGTRAGDLLNRDFSAQAPNRKWITDFTYVRTWSPSWVYVHRGLLLPAHRRVARPDQHAHRSGDDPAEDRHLAARSRRASRDPR